VRYGWHSVLDYNEPPRGAIAIVTASRFPDEKLLKDTMRGGLDAFGNKVTWIIRETPHKGHAVNLVVEVFEEYGIEPFTAPTLDYWQNKQTWRKRVKVPKDLDECVLAGQELKFVEHVHGYDLRGEWKDIELRSTCERIVVFHDRSSSVTEGWLDYAHEPWRCRARVMVAEAGAKKRARRGTGSASRRS
jgi:hypothetical protein